MKKILFILHTPPPVHGASTVGRYINESFLINTSFNTNYIRLGTTNNFQERGKTNFTKVFRYFKLCIISIFTTLKFKPHLIYISITSKGIGFYKDAFLVLLLKTFNKNIVFHLHNKGVSNRQHQLFDNLLYKIVFRNSDVILLSEHLYFDVKKYVSRSNIHICPNGLPPVQNSTFLKNGNKRIEILFISNLIVSKGVWVLLKACKLLKDKGLIFRCTYIGAESEVTKKDLEEAIIHSGLQEYVRYLDPQYGAAKEFYLNQSDIFVHPTFNDCFPLVLLEAMQHSLPIISTFEGGIPDIVENGETGYLVKPKDIKELADKIKILIEDDMLRKEMGKKAQEKYLKKFTLEKFENRLYNILNDLTYEDNK